jgi:hypothetical protein
VQHDFDLIVDQEVSETLGPYLGQAPTLFAQTLNGVNPPWGLDVALREVLADTTLAEGLRWELITEALHAGMPLPVVLGLLKLPVGGFHPDVWRVEAITAQAPAVARAVAAGCSFAQIDQTHGPFASNAAREALDLLFCARGARVLLEQGQSCAGALEHWGRTILPASPWMLRFLAFRDDACALRMYEQQHNLPAEPEVQQAFCAWADTVAEGHRLAWSGTVLERPTGAQAAGAPDAPDARRLSLEMSLAFGCAGRDVWLGALSSQQVSDHYGITLSGVHGLLDIFESIRRPQGYAREHHWAHLGELNQAAPIAGIAL